MIRSPLHLATLKISVLMISVTFLSTPSLAMNLKLPVTPVVINAEAYGVTPDDGRDDAAVLQSILDNQSLERPLLIRLPAGKLDFYHRLTISRSDVTLEGAGENKTEIVSHLDRNEADSVINIEGGKGTRVAMLRADAGRQDLSLRVSIPALQKGDNLLLRQPNDAAFLRKIGATLWNRKYPYLRQAIVRVDGVSAERVSITAETGIKFAAAKTQVYLLQPVSHVILRNFSVRQVVPNADIAPLTFVYENSYPNYEIDEIALNWTTGVHLEHLRLLSAGSHPIAINNSYGVNIQHIFIDGAWNKGKKGNGYLRMERSYYGLVSDVTVLNIRHIAIQWSSAFNILEKIRANVDINFHGGYSHDNRVVAPHIVISPRHPWPPIYRTPGNAHWAPPDGPGNEVTKLNTTPPLGAAGL